MGNEEEEEEEGEGVKCASAPASHASGVLGPPPAREAGTLETKMITLTASSLFLKRASETGSDADFP